MTKETRVKIGLSILIYMVCIVVMFIVVLSCGSGANPETAKKEFIDIANKMGPKDEILASQAIDMVENQDYIKRGGWQPIDRMMSQVTPETISAYYKWRDAMIKQTKKSGK